MVLILKSCYPNVLLSASRDGTVLLWMEDYNNNNILLCSKINLIN